MLEDVGEADQAGELNVALAQLINEFFQIDARLCKFALGMNRDMHFVIDREVSVSPVADAVEARRVVGGPGAGNAGGGVVGYWWVLGTNSLRLLRCRAVAVSVGL